MKYFLYIFVLLILIFSCSRTTDSNQPTPTPVPSGLVCFENKTISPSNGVDIATINANGSQFQSLSINNFVNGFYSNNSTPRLSFDKSKIVFTSNRDGEQNDYDIYIMNANGTSIQKITNNPNRSEEFASCGESAG